MISSGLQFASVKILIWDFDGTLYIPNQALWNEVREAEYRTIMEKRQWSHEQAVAEFERYYKKITPSATRAVAQICGITTAEAAAIMERYYDRRTFLTRDEKLISLFQTLTHFTHFILANGVRHRIEETLEVLGVPKSTFQEILTAETTGENKPDDRGFRYIMEKTKLPAASHLMIGDREAVDLVPAKALGMHTCLVWSDVLSPVADVTVKTVYDIAQLL